MYMGHNPVIPCIIHYILVFVFHKLQVVILLYYLIAELNRISLKIKAPVTHKFLNYRKANENKENPSPGNLVNKCLD